ncbi:MULTISPECIES: sensor histidine kinase [Streptosporangium]|uniref:Signal transduction histidine kinase n=1 Tax=Streptosporangium brasiliense TaxID=47480 RepID=A0ABT9QXC4_9ACTN|nr:sensor histidine kinase [Streptosporangium brasiliense]MDP9861627.1 signal transduction histidine kinase [Streptosporangium brasiliense]
MVLIIVVAATAVALTVIGFVITLRLPPGWFPDMLLTPDLAGGLTFPLVGAFLLAHRSRPATAWLMCVGGLGCAINIFATGMMLRSGAEGALAAAGYYRYAAGIGWIMGGMLLASLLPLYSPDGRLPSRRWRPLVVLAGALMVVESARMIVRPTPPLDDYPLPRVIPNPLAVEALTPYGRQPQQLLMVLIMGVAILSLLSLMLRFRRADPVLRRQIAWPLSAFALYIVFMLLGEDWAPAATVATGLIPVAIAFSVLRYRLYGIDTVISRAFVAAGLITAISAVYFGVGAVTGLALSGYDRVGGLAAALFAGVVFHPLRHLLRRWVDRLMYGTHGDPRALAARLAQEAGETEPANALAAVAAVVRDGLSVTGVVVEVDGVGGRRVEVGLLGPAPRAVPLVWHGEPVGRLLLGSPGPRRFAAAHNDRLIAVVTPYVADVVHAVRMTADLQRSRERILTAREEERRRLRRDLHDGLGHALTDMAMSINMAKISLRTAPASADRLLSELRSGMDAVGQEIRELVYGLRPPTLDELGLAGAVRALAVEGEPRVAVETEGDLSDLPAAAEVAAYRIAQEGLTNIRKHAGARSAVVSLRRGESLVVRVQDDGHGLPAGPRSGVGLLSMRERAAELGGTCVIGAAPGGGTVVEAVLPIPAGRM